MSTTFDKVVAALSGHRFTPSAEADLQLAIGRLFDSLGIEHEREVELGSRSDRIDFLCTDVGVEVKVDGWTSDVARQLQRYAKSDRVAHLVLATRMRRHEGIAGAKFNGKAVHVVRLRGWFL